MPPPPADVASRLGQAPSSSPLACGTEEPASPAPVLPSCEPSGGAQSDGDADADTDAENASPAAFRCIICLDDCAASSRARALRCAHPVCADCLRAMWTHDVETSSLPFPRCPMPGCGAYASDAAVAGLVAPQAARRMRQLRALKPARAADGRRMFCIRPGCHEQLPPPPPPSAAGGGDAGGADGADGDGEGSRVSTCPECDQHVCMRCGCEGHAGRECVTPLTSGRHDRLYHSYAVGRVSECPRCGVHIERSGGCRSVTCGHCKWTFTFRPFQTAAEAEQSMAREIPASSPPPPETHELPLEIVRHIFRPETWFREATANNVRRGSQWMSVVLSVLWAFNCMLFLGLSAFTFLLGFLRLFQSCFRMLGEIGQPGARAVKLAVLRAALGIVMLLGHDLVSSMNPDFVQSWTGMFWSLAVSAGGRFLFFISMSHLIAVCVRTCRRALRL